MTRGAKSEERPRTAMRALVERHGDLIADVIRGDEAINRLHMEIDDRCFRLLALHQPVAVDATNIAEDVIFIVEARDVRHHAADGTT